MAADPRFKSHLKRAQKQAIKELKQGCNDCRETSGGLCESHFSEAVEITLRPANNQLVQDILGAKRKQGK